MDNTLDNRQTILTKWANENLFRTITFNTGGKTQQDYNLDDLAQDLFISVSSKPLEWLQEMDNIKKGKRQIVYWLSRAAVNAVYSNRSTYYLRYRKFSAKSEKIPQE